jgi:hypothetical protein
MVNSIFRVSNSIEIYVLICIFVSVQIYHTVLQGGFLCKESMEKVLFQSSGKSNNSSQYSSDCGGHCCLCSPACGVFF